MCLEIHQASKVLLFEKFWAFQSFVRGFKNAHNFYVMCSCGVPSRQCLNHLRKLKGKKILYFGDLDPTSIYTYLSFVFCKRRFKAGDRKLFDVKFAGLTFEDCKRFLSLRCRIKLNNKEEIVLSFVKGIGRGLKKELSFLEKGYKVEMEALRPKLEKYFKSKL